MTQRPSNFIWYELMTKDIDAASDFYNHVIGWTVQRSQTPDLDYRMWLADKVSIGGLMTIPTDAAAKGLRPTWLAYLSVPDVDQSMARIQAAGGTLYTPVVDMPGIGRFAMVSDPQGAPFYVMTPASFGNSSAYAPDKAGHGGWHELHTTDWQSAMRFYGDHFGWQEAEKLDMGPAGTYAMFNVGGEMIGGMMNSADTAKPHWLFYFVVTDIEQAQSRVVAAGGTVSRGPTQVPGGGWIIQGVDPQGAKFALFSASVSTTK